jgi:hypothetical protein
MARPQQAGKRREIDLAALVAQERSQLPNLNSYGWLSLGTTGAKRRR